MLMRDHVEYKNRYKELTIIPKELPPCLDCARRQWRRIWQKRGHSVFWHTYDYLNRA
ncbi:MAG: hypothetical protein ACYYK0_05720 [Candidatus Eutrophobiaceae bacterium]